MKVVTAEQIRELDRRAMEEFGIAGVALMENAGRAVVDVMAREHGPLAGRRVAVLCGAGNNGGDGFVIARYLHLAGAEPRVMLLGNPDSLKADARTHFQVYRNLKLRLSTAPDVAAEIDGLSTYDLLVDALLGTGIKDAPRDAYAQAIAALNKAGRPVISVDVPSGLNSDTGETPGAIVRATHTVTFAYPKLGLFLYPGADCMGRLHVSDIGFPWDRLNMPTTCRLIA